MAKINNIRRRGKYSCHDFPRLGVSLLYNCITKKYGIYKIKDKPQIISKKCAPSKEIKPIQIALACVLGIVLVGHMILLFSKFV